MEARGERIRLNRDTTGTRPEPLGWLATMLLTTNGQLHSYMAILFIVAIVSTLSLRVTRMHVSASIAVWVTFRVVVSTAAVIASGKVDTNCSIWTDVQLFINICTINVFGHQPDQVFPLSNHTILLK